MSDVDHLNLRGEDDPDTDPGLDRPPELTRRHEERSTWLWIGGTIVVLALVAGGAWWLWRSDPPVAEQPTGTADAPPAEERSPEEPRAPLPALDESDPLVRELVSALSSHPQLARWLVTDDLLRRTAKVVGNVAWGEDPSTHVQFLRPAAPFRVEQRGEAASVDARSYERYDLAVDVFTSIDAPGAAALYRRFRPLWAEAYAELGYPGSWDEAVRTAVRVVLETPALPEDVELARDAVSYRYRDPELEALPPAQKLVLRAGPRNAERLKAKVRELASAAGIG